MLKLVELLTIIVKLSFVLLMLVEVLTITVIISFLLLMLVEMLTSTAILYCCVDVGGTVDDHC